MHFCFTNTAHHRLDCLEVINGGLELAQLPWLNLGVLHLQLLEFLLLHPDASTSIQQGDRFQNLYQPKLIPVLEEEISQLVILASPGRS